MNGKFALFVSRNFGKFPSQILSIGSWLLNDHRLGAGQNLYFENKRLIREVRVNQFCEAVQNNLMETCSRHLE
jgi:hypothetical protein